jgi:hypothetical protein
MREIHGIDDAQKRTMIDSGETQQVTVRDGKDGKVCLNVGHQTYTAGLSPEQARWIAKELIASAKRVERTASDGTDA